MKIRNGFVSNSSSSSFIVRNLTAKQMREISAKLDSLNSHEQWNIVEYGPDWLEMSTPMDNFSWSEFFFKIGVKEEDVKYLY